MFWGKQMRNSRYAQFSLRNLSIIFGVLLFAVSPALSDLGPCRITEDGVFCDEPLCQAAPEVLPIRQTVFTAKDIAPPPAEAFPVTTLISHGPKKIIVSFSLATGTAQQETYVTRWRY